MSKKIIFGNHTSVNGEISQPLLSSVLRRPKLVTCTTRHEERLIYANISESDSQWLDHHSAPERGLGWGFYRFLYVPCVLCVGIYFPSSFHLQDLLWSAAKIYTPWPWPWPWPSPSPSPWPALQTRLLYAALRCSSFRFFSSCTQCLCRAGVTMAAELPSHRVSDSLSDSMKQTTWEVELNLRQRSVWAILFESWLNSSQTNTFIRKEWQKDEATRPEKGEGMPAGVPFGN